MIIAPPNRSRKRVTATSLALMALMAHGMTGHVFAAPISKTTTTATQIGDITTLSGHVPALATRSQVVSRLDSAQPLSLALTLPLRNQSELTDLLQHITDPTDPQYGQYLTPEQFTARFGPTPADYNKAIAYAQAAGLTVTGTHPNRTLLDVDGTAGQVERAFGVQLQVYQSPDDGRYFYAPNAEPRVSASVGTVFSGIVGLDNATVWKPHHRVISPVSDDPFAPYLLPRTTGSGLGGGLTPSDIKTAYGLNGVTQTGSGQSLALFELANYSASDITYYENYFFGSTVNVPLTNVTVGSGIGSNGADEVTLDIELQIALAPGATRIYVYEAPNSSTGVVNEYNKIATDNLAKQISTSWGSYETSSLSAVTRSSENTAFQQMAAQGQSIFAASGDDGAYDDTANITVDDPASQPYMTGVGGTKLATNGGGGAYATEKTWGDPTEIYYYSNGTAINPHGSGGGGGISTVWSIPAYQLASATASITNTPTGKVSTTKRNVPDVSLNADVNTGYLIRYGGGWNIFGGTSCAAPLWSAFAALANQQRVASGYNPLGFFNPALYTIAKSSRYSTDFHDIADASTNLYYPAVAGFDDATGLGTFNGANLLVDLATAVPISGTIALQNVVAPNLSQPLTFTITPTGTPTGATPQPVTTQTVTPAADGTFTLYGVPSGTYTLGIKGSKWLKKNISINTTAGAVTGLAISLMGGDCNNDNLVSLSDYFVLLNAFGSNPASANWNAGADLNCDGIVSLGDYFILLNSFGKIGD